MPEIELTVRNEAGIHLKVAGKIVGALEPLAAKVLVRKGNMTLNAKSVIGLTGLAAGKGTVLKFIAEGEQAEEALKILRALFANGFR